MIEPAEIIGDDCFLEGNVAAGAFHVGWVECKIFIQSHNDLRIINSSYGFYNIGARIMSKEKYSASDNFGERLRTYRKKCGKTGVEFSNLIGISQGSLSDIENGKSQPSAKVFFGLLENTDVNLRWLITGKEEGENKNIALPFLNKIGEWLKESCEREPFRKDWFIGQFRDAFPAFVKWEEGKEETQGGEDKFPTSKVA